MPPVAMLNHRNTTDTMVFEYEDAFQITISDNCQIQVFSQPWNGSFFHAFPSPFQGDKNLYDLPPEEASQIPQVCGSLEEALNSLAADHEYLLKGNVFSKDLIEAYIDLKKQDVDRIRMAPHPLEFELYYSL